MFHTKVEWGHHWQQRQHCKDGKWKCDDDIMKKKIRWGPSAIVGKFADSSGWKLTIHLNAKQTNRNEISKKEEEEEIE